ncbi:POT family-domain-containing protein [Chytriomyces sp. MP71]|nr:POT family-domain-containing protein [Chytriomyces sp. MP71]
MFTGLAYFTPVLGAMIRDYFWTILTITSSPIIMGIATTHIGRAGPNFGLLLVCLGTGGIKPCISAHGGDQFLEVQKLGLQKFHNYFYMAINTGALVSSHTSPAVVRTIAFPFGSTVIQRFVNAHCNDADICQSSVSITLQIFLYFVIPCAECLFSISGLNFAYVEVGKRTKSTCAAIWLLTSGFGSFMAAALLGDHDGEPRLLDPRALLLPCYRIVLRERCAAVGNQ